ncbi:MAG: pyruvate kinase [Candidatus Bruticola sp.]
MNFRRTKIVATIGPASQDKQMLDKLVKTGMNVARLNFSHGTHQSHQELYNNLREVGRQNDVFITVLQDLCGPKIRLGTIKEGSVMEVGQTCIFTAEEIEGDAHVMHVSYPRLAEEVKPGSLILLDDGSLQCRVEEVKGGKVYAKVLVGGPVSSHKGVNLPGTKLSIPSLTEKDADDLRFGLKMGVDYVAMSFVRSPRDIEPARRIMDEVGIHRPIIAKIEKPEALDCIEEIINAFDGIMVARGDLGVEMPIDDIPIVQKRLIKLAREQYKPVICATQMLDSMIRNPRPTRAEVTDIANAIFDGVDAVMLSGETASGAYPEEAVSVMASVALKAEEYLPYDKIFTLDIGKEERPRLGCDIALSACEIAEASEAKAILACTSEGRTARFISHFRPRTPVLGVAYDITVARQMNLLFGVVPALVKKSDTISGMFMNSVTEALRRRFVYKGDKAIVVAGFPPGEPTNCIFVNTVK